MTKTRELRKRDCPHKPWPHNPTPSEVVTSLDTLGNLMTGLTKPQAMKYFFLLLTSLFLMQNAPSNGLSLHSDALVVQQRQIVVMVTPCQVLRHLMQNR